jgi:hypothetical protein
MAISGVFAERKLAYQLSSGYPPVHVVAGLSIQWIGMSTFGWRSWSPVRASR